MPQLRVIIGSSVADVYKVVCDQADTDLHPVFDPRSGPDRIRATRPVQTQRDSFHRLPVRSHIPALCG